MIFVNRLKGIMPRQRSIVEEQFWLIPVMPMFSHSMLISYGKLIKMLLVPKAISSKLLKLTLITGKINIFLPRLYVLYFDVPIPLFSNFVCHYSKSKLMPNCSLLSQGV